MPAIPTARVRARAALTVEIKAEAGRQIAVGGASSLSLRSVARHLGMASSAIYRYFPSRDELLTALIVDAYDDLGRSAEGANAAAAPDDLAGRWLAVGRAVRTWALAHPHEYALLYGSPVPGYQAPERTIGPGTRVTLVLVGILQAATRLPVSADRPVAAGRAAGSEGRPGDRCRGAGTVRGGELPPGLAADLEKLAERAMPGVPPDLMARGLVAWTQLFGMISFELFGQLKGMVEDDGALFEHAAVAMAAFVGLESPVARP